MVIISEKEPEHSWCQEGNEAFLPGACALCCVHLMCKELGILGGFSGNLLLPRICHGSLPEHGLKTGTSSSFSSAFPTRSVFAIPLSLWSVTSHLRATPKCALQFPCPAQGSGDVSLALSPVCLQEREQMQRYNQRMLEQLKVRQQQERARLPKIQRSEGKTRMAMYKKSLHIHSSGSASEQREKIKQVRA